MSKSKGGHYRSTISGRYVTTKHGVASPRTTVHEALGSKGSTHGSYRSAVSGEFVKSGFGKAHQPTTEKNR